MITSIPIWVKISVAKEEGKQNLERGRPKIQIKNKEMVVNGKLDSQISVMGRFGDFFWGDNQDGLY